MRYNPTDEWELRREVRLLAKRLEATGKNVHIISMSDLLWDALDKVNEKDDDEGFDAVVALERSSGFVKAQHQITTYLSSKKWMPLWELLADRLASIADENSIVFITRVASMSPTVLFYPGSIEGTTGLRFMDLKDRDALGNYRVKIYG